MNGWNKSFRVVARSLLVKKAMEGLSRLYFADHLMAENRKMEFTADLTCSIEEAMRADNDKF